MLSQDAYDRIKSMVLESDCLGLSHLLLWTLDIQSHICLFNMFFFFFFCTITMCQVLFEVPEIHPGSKEAKPSVCVEFR